MNKELANREVRAKRGDILAQASYAASLSRRVIRAQARDALDQAAEAAKRSAGAILMRDRVEAEVKSTPGLRYRAEVTHRWYENIMR